MIFYAYDGLHAIRNIVSMYLFILGQCARLKRL